MATPQQQLNANQRRRNIIEAGLLASLAVAMVAVALIAYRDFSADSPYPWIGKVLASTVVAFLAGALYMILLKPIYAWLERCFAPSWVLVVCDGVVKVHGEVPLVRWGEVQAQMLAARPGLMPVKEAWGRYGCTMAAVPASPEYVAASEQLASLGFKNWIGSCGA
jgi:hypothetical protein